MRVKTSVKAGGMGTYNHNTAAGLKVKTGVKAGALADNHSAAAGLKVRAAV